MKSLAETSPRRTCVGCGKRDAQRALMRFVVEAGGLELVNAKVARGRSAYIHHDGQCIARLAKSRWVDRSLRVRTDKLMRAQFAALLMPVAGARASQTER